MARLLERMFLLLVWLSIVLWLATLAFRGLRLVAARLQATATPLLESMIVTVVVGCFSVGCIVRFACWWQEIRRSHGQQRPDRDRLRRRDVRRPTEDPRQNEPRQHLQEDDDPALTFGLEE